MRKIQKLFFILIIIAAAAAVIAKGLLWHFGNRAAKNIQNSLPHGVFVYKNVTTSLKGRISINQVTINLPMHENPISIEKLELVEDNIFSLAMLYFNNYNKKFPEQLRFRIQGLQLALSDLMSQGGFSQSSMGMPCGGITSISAVELIQMGYHRFIADIDIFYRLNLEASTMRLTIGSNVRDFVKTDMTFSGEVPMGAFARTASMQSRNFVPEFEMHIKEFAFMNKLVSFCAAQEKKPVDEYRTILKQYLAETTRNATAESLGTDLNIEIMTALNEYVMNPQEFYFSLKPRGGISLQELQTSSEQRAMDLLRPSLRINGKSVPINFKWNASIRGNADGQVGKTPTIISRERELTPISALNNKARNKWIELHTKSGSVYKGTFKRVEGDSVYMIIREGRDATGSSDIFFNKSVITRVYVLESIVD